MLQLPTSYLFYTLSLYCQWHSLSRPHPPLSFLCPRICSLRLCLYSCPANGFVCTIILDSTLTYNLYFSLSDRLHSVWQPLCPSTSLQMTLWHVLLKLKFLHELPSAQRSKIGQLRADDNYCWCLWNIYHVPVTIWIFLEGLLCSKHFSTC